MGRIEVDPTELSGLATSLRQFSSAGDDTRTALGAVTTAQTGHGGLASAVGRFVSDWEFSLKKIGENAAAMSDKLAKSAEGYAMTDQAIGNVASGQTADPTATA
jgi:hypothetical protein